MAAQNGSLTEFFELMKAQEVVIVEGQPRPPPSTTTCPSSTENS
jgi:hypothetical protein